MAVSMRGTLLLASAAVLQTSAQHWTVFTKYSDSACTAKTDEVALWLDDEHARVNTGSSVSDGCIDGVIGSERHTCSGGKLTTEAWMAKGCSGSPTLTQTADSCVPEEGGIYGKVSCGTLPPGMKAVTYTTFDGEGCTGRRTGKTTLAYEVDVCRKNAIDGYYEKITSNSTALVYEVYAAEGCNGLMISSETERCSACMGGDFITCHDELSRPRTFQRAFLSHASAIEPSMAVSAALMATMAFFA